MRELNPDDLLKCVKAAHERESAFFGELTEERLRAPTALPGWTRGHLLACRLAFLRAARRQVEAALDGRSVPFYQGGPDGRADREADRAGRDAEIEANAYRPADELVREVRRAIAELEAALSGVGHSDWARPAMYRGGGGLLDVLTACWRESEVHLVDFDLGAGPSAWSREFCLHLFDYRGRRIRNGLRIELTTPEGEAWTVGAGERVEVRGALTDLAAWLGGRQPEGALESSTGALPEIKR